MKSLYPQINGFINTAIRHHLETVEILKIKMGPPCKLWDGPFIWNQAFDMVNVHRSPIWSPASCGKEISASM